MKQANKLFYFLLYFLLLTGISSCNSCKSEKEKLEAEEKVLMGKLQENFKLEPWKILESTLMKDKNNKEKIEQHIQNAEDGLIVAQKVEKGEIVPTNDRDGLVNYLKQIKATSIDLSSKENIALLKKVISDFSAVCKNLKQQAELKN